MSTFDKELHIVLKDIGLSNTQIDFYIFVLKNGPSTASKIAKNIGVNRTNAYNITNKLKELNLVSEINTANGKLIQAESYNNILEKISQNQDRLEESKEKIKNLIPIFNSFQVDQNSQSLQIRLFNGKEAIINIMEDMHSQINKNSNTADILLFTNQQAERKIFNQKKHNEFIKKRVEKKIKIRVLAVDNKEGRDLQKNDKNFLRQTKILPKNFSYNAEIYIYNNRVSILDIQQDIVGLIIESPELSLIHRQMFEWIWGE